MNVCFSVRAPNGMVIQGLDELVYYKTSLKQGFFVQMFLLGKPKFLFAEATVFWM